MGYFDGLVASSFKKDADGRTLFYPYGILGGGRYAPSEADAQSLKSVLKIKFAVVLPLIILLTVFRMYAIEVTALILYLIAYPFWISRRISDWKPSEVTLAYTESVAASSQALGMTWLLVLLTASLLLCLGGLFLLIMAPDQWLVGASSLLFFALISGAFLYRIRMLTKSETRSPR